MPLQEQQCEIRPDQGSRLDKAVRLLTGRSWSDTFGLISLGHVQLNGVPCTDPAQPTQPGDTLVVRHDPRQRYHAQPRSKPDSAFQLIHEDDFLIVVDKTANILTVPTDHGENHTLIAAIDRHLARTSRHQAIAVHRLDRGTSGLLVFAKRPKAAQVLMDQFRAHLPEREYVAIVAGRLKKQEGTFESRLATTKSLQRYSVHQDEEEGERAVTHYEVERHLHDATAIRVRLETGRRNQIRVHFSEAGHPVLGDERYRPDLAMHPAWKSRRLALHAAKLGFTHPETGQKLRFETQPPAPFQRFLARR